MKTILRSVLEKDVEDQLERYCKKKLSIIVSQGGREHPTYNKTKEG
jgi:hypothetical protein